MPIRIAVATDDGETIGWGHFAHNKYFIIYDISKNEVKIIERRFNPFSSIPDIDATETHSHIADSSRELVSLHGMEKYSTLRKKFLNDVNMIIASGGCPTSIVYFTGEGVRFLFAEPDTRIDDIISELSNIVESFDELPAILTFEEGKIVTDY